MSDAVNDLPLDETSRATLAAEGLRYAVLDPADEQAHGRWLQAYHRGFHFDALTPEQLDEYRARLAGPRLLGVWDATTAEPEDPIATVGSWRSPLSLGEGSSVDGWAISLVSVAATHRRRGIGRAILEGELRAAHAAGLAVAMITVSEATIYGRWGFGPAAYTADYRVDARGLSVTAPVPAGRVQRVSAAALRPMAPDLAERASQRFGGEVLPRELHWNRMFALSTRSAAHATQLRAARFDDAAGEPQGFVLYSLTEHASDFAANTLTVEYLCAATDDALVGLWHYILDQDLVATVVASLRPVDEPLPWLVSNSRAVHVTDRREHLWLRVLDVPAALSARRYATTDSVLLRVSDPMGFASGDWMLRTDHDGRATVTRTDAAQPAVPDPAVATPAVTTPAVLTLGVESLSSLLLGGTPVDALRLAGDVTEDTPGAAARLGALLHTPRAPYLSTWF
jgi:predicted acetyltransferase